MRSIATKLAGMAAMGILVTATGQASAQQPGAHTYTMGSDLTHSADATVQQPVDTALWALNFHHLQTNFPGATTAQASSPMSGALPGDGQIVTVRVKGTALPNSAPGAPPPLTQIHFQDLQPQPDGSLLVVASSQPFNLPTGGDPNQITTYAPTNLCVHKGDYLALNDEGGFDPNFYPQGVAFQVLSNVVGSTTDRFSGHNQTGNGSRFTGIPMQNQELLMQWDLAVGPDATPLCPGGGHQTIFGVLDPPIFGSTVDVEAISGTVFYKPPLTARVSRTARKRPKRPSKGQGFIPLTSARQIPIGSLIDTSHGVVRTVTATAAGETQTGDFGAGIFQILQNRSEFGLAQLTLTGGLHQAKACRRPAGKKASAAALSSRVLRLLRSNVHGGFRTRGNFAAATVRGTEWEMDDRCDGTFTRVQRGTVVVHDFRKKKDITVNAGQSYLAHR